jgi:predicted ribosomally synthesized peptide with SipW-like signal peptide
MFRKTRLLLTLGVLGGAVWAGTFATFTDSGTAASTFTAGTVDLLVNSEADDDYAFTSLEMSNMKPTDVKYAALTVANNGTLSFDYSMATSATGASGSLKDQLRLGVRKVSSTCDATNYNAASGANILFAEAALSGGAIVSRTLASGNEVLCFKVELPTGVGDTFQGATTTATFTFSATQS